MIKKIKNIIIALMVMATMVAHQAQTTFASEGTRPVEYVSNNSIASERDNSPASEIESEIDASKCQVSSRTSLIGRYSVINEDGSRTLTKFTGREIVWISRLEWQVKPTRSSSGIVWYVLAFRSPGNPGGGKLIYTWGWQNLPYCPTYRRVL